MTPSWLRRGYMALIALFLMAPLIVVFGVSLNEKQSLLFPPEGLSLDWYAEIFTDDGWRGALFASVGLAALSAALAVILAMPLTWFLWRRRAPWARVFQALGVELGRASCRARVCQSVLISVVAVYLKKKQNNENRYQTH